MRTCEDSFADILNGFSSQLLVEKPARITKVYNQYCVDIEYSEGGISDSLPRVPVKHLQTNRAFVFLKLKEGDMGTVRFFDNDVDGYKRGTIESEAAQVSESIRKHDINDNLYDFGFYPEKEQYIMPDSEICIGLRNQSALIEFTENGNIVLKANSLSISGATIQVTGSNVEIGNSTKIDGKDFLSHTHSNGHEGSPTGGVL